MKRITRILTSSGLVLSAALAFSGCALFGGGGGDDASGGADGGGATASDPTAYAQAPGTVSIKAGAVGYMIANKTVGTGYENTGSVAIVGETGDSWLVETASSASDGYLMGLTVSKEDGKVTAAVMGKAGEAGKEIKVMAATATPAGPDGVAEEVTIGIGSFASTKVVTDYGTSWSGTEGELAGIMLKYESKDATYELAKMPEAGNTDLGGTSVKIVKLVYSNDSEYWRTANAVVSALATAGDGVGTVKTVMAGMTIELTAVKTDAAPQLKWAK
jgi:hypothetical protein